MNLHRLAEERSLAYHRAVAERLAREPALLDVARARVAGWIAERRSPWYAERWHAILARPGTEITRFLVDERGRVLRGARAVAEVWRRLPGGWPLVGLIAAYPPVSWLAALVYRWVARNRHRLGPHGGSCAVEEKP